jgi:flagellin FlaB
MPKLLIYREVRRVKITLTRRLLREKNAAVGIGTLIIFIAMILVAGITASVIIQTMNSLEQQALQTGLETMRDVSSGLRVTQVSGYNNGSTISQIAIFLRTTAGSDDIDLTYAYISLSDTSKSVILNFNTSIFNSSISGGLFGTLDDTQLTESTYGLMVVRDVDNSCVPTNPTINNDDLVVLLVNSSACFTGIDPRTEVSGNVVPEYGISGLISFTTPSAYINTIIEL